MAKQLFYVPESAVPLIDEAKRYAAEDGRSFSDVVVGLLALYVKQSRAAAEPAPDPLQLLMAASAEAGTEEGPCDRCGQPGALLRGEIDLTGARSPAMILERLCQSCRDLNPRWPL